MKLATSIDIADDVITNKKSNVMLFFVLTLTDFVRRCLFEIIFLSNILIILTLRNCEYAIGIFTSCSSS